MTWSRAGCEIAWRQEEQGDGQLAEMEEGWMERRTHKGHNSAEEENDKDEEEAEERREDK